MDNVQNTHKRNTPSSISSLVPGTVPPVGKGVALASVFTLVVAPLALLVVQGLSGAGTSSGQGRVLPTAVERGIDTDRDGVPDAKDLFPRDKREWADTDRDKVGDNSDPDRDGDGYLNTVDLFPDGARGKLDFDNDWTPDPSDLDIDGDGISNVREKGGAKGTYAYDGNNDGRHDRLQRALNKNFDTDGDGKPDVAEIIARAQEFAEGRYKIKFTGGVKDFSDFPEAFWQRAGTDAGELAAIIYATQDRDNDGLVDWADSRPSIPSLRGLRQDYVARYEQNQDVFAAKARDLGFAVGAPAGDGALGPTLIGDAAAHQLPPTYREGSGFGLYTPVNAVPEFKNETAERAFYNALYETGKPPPTFSGHYEVYSSSESGSSEPILYNPAQFTRQYEYTTGSGAYDSGAGTGGVPTSPGSSGAPGSGYQPPPGSSPGSLPPPPPFPPPPPPPPPGPPPPPPPPP